MKDRTRQAAEWLTDKYIMLMLLVFPLFMGIHGYVKITLSKYLFFSITTGLWLAGILLLWIVGGAHKRLLPVQLLVIAWGAWACLSSAVSPWRTESLLGASRFDGLLTLLLYVGIFCGVSAYGSWRPRYVWLLGCSAAICAAVSFFQIAGASILFPNGYTYYDAGVLYISKFLGTIGNTNLLAAFLCMSVPLCAAAEACGWKAVWFLRGVYMSGACLLSFTESSGGMLALAVAYTVCALAFAGKGRLPQFIKIAARTAFGLGIGSLLRNAPGEACALFLMAGMAFAAACGFQRFIPVRYHFCCTIFILAAVLLFGGALVYFWPVSSGTIYELSRMLHGEVQDSFGSSRIRIWRETLALVPERLLFGGGPGTLALRLDLSFSRYFPALKQTLQTYTDNAHNVYLGYLVNIGLPGLGLYLTVIGLTLYRIFRSRSAWMLIPGAALICIWIENFFGLGLCLTAPIMWVLWGLIYTQKLTGVELNEEANTASSDLYAAGDIGGGIPDDGQAPWRTEQDGTEPDTFGRGDGGAESGADNTDSHTDADT